jgi:glycosyltransferase involved in cell wall biosynthesis
MFPIDNEVSILSGHIDIIDVGVVRGWVYDPENPTEPAPFFLAIDDKIVSVSKAGLFRADLKDAGYSDGYHAFSLVIDLGRLVFGTRVISILDHRHRIINRREVNLGNSSDIPKIDLVSSKSSTLEFTYQSVQKPDNVEIHLYAEHEVIWIGKVEFDAKFGQFYLPVPHTIIDGREHTLSIGMRGVIPLLWSGVVLMSLPAYSINSITGLLIDQSDVGQGSRSSHRYKSLSQKLEHLHDVDQASAMHQAHKFMLDGCASNVELPILSMPKSGQAKVSVIITSVRDIKSLFHLIASFILSSESVKIDITVFIDPVLSKNQNELNKLEGITFVERAQGVALGQQITDIASSQFNKFLLLCNGLHESCSQLVSQMVQRLDDDDRIGVLGARLLSDEGRIWESGIRLSSEGHLEVFGSGKSWLDPEMAVAIDCTTFLDSPVCIRTQDLLSCSGQLNNIKNNDQYIYKICQLVSTNGKQVRSIPQATGFAFPHTKRRQEKKLHRVQKLDRLIQQSNFIPAHGGKLHSVKKRIMMIDMTTPTPDRDAGSYAAMQEIRLLRSFGFDITFVPLDLLYKIKYTSQLQALGVEVLYQPFYRQIGDIILQRMASFSGVYVTRYNVAAQFIDILKSHFPHIPIIFNNADLHFLREIRTALTNNNKAELEQALVTRNDELAIINKVDAVLSYTETEQAVITSHLLESKNLFKCPWILQQKPKGLKFSDRNGIAFLGGFKHLPNVQAVDYFVNQIMPVLKDQAPEIKLYIYGANMPDRFAQYQSDNVELVGFVENLEQVFNHCRIFVAPLLAGAGIKGKVLEAMSFNVPCILSSVAAEGTGLTHGLTTMIADKPEEWVSGIRSLYNDEQQWNRIVDNQQILVENQYSFEHGKLAMHKILDSVGLI